jgi:2-polyprenyl-3-methyl-5-hydroxy-6-metoxy-1,4-benzoquinol methylase
VCDRVWSIDVEQVPFERDIEPGSLDAILCLDVLEHLVDPWAVVKRLSALLRPGGRLIVSVPNIRNWKFIRGLLFRGDFHYRDSGLLDRTHLRFFVRATAITLAASGGLTVVQSVALPVLRPGETRWVLVKASLGGLEDLLAKQWLLVAERT